MRITDKTKRRTIYPLFFILFAVFVVYEIIQYSSRSDDVRVKTFKTSDGWGYQITVKDRVFIDQPFIPVIQGRKAFPDRRTALKAGSIVKQKLDNRELPGLSIEDIKKLGIDSLGNSEKN